MSKARRFVTVAAAGLLIACQASGDTPSPTTASSSTAGPPDAGSIYANEAEGFSLTYPDGWKEEPGNAFFVVNFYPEAGALDGFAENLGVSTERLPEGMTFAEYLEAGQAQIEGLGGTFTGSEDTALAGFPAVREDYRLEYEGSDLRGTQWTTNADGAIYILTFTAEPGDPFKEWLPQVEGIVESFELI